MKPVMELNPKTVHQIRYFANSVALVRKPFANPILVSKLRSQGVLLQEKNFEALKLSPKDLERLGDAGIFTLEQLADCIETVIATIPHFGKVKIQRLKANLQSYLLSLLCDAGEESDKQYRLPITEPVKSVKVKRKFTRVSPKANFISDLEGD